jgi:hypothetical protein
MNNLETRLRNMRLAAPSSELDRRITDALADGDHVEESPRPSSKWWVLWVLTASGAAAGLILISPWATHRSPAQNVYRIEAKGRLRQMLLVPPSGTAGLPQLSVNPGAP